MADDTRPLTDPERRYLEWHRLEASGGSVRSILYGGGFCSGCLLLIVLGIAGLVGTLSRLQLRSLDDRITLGLLIGVPLLVGTASVVYSLLDRQKMARRLSETRSQIDADLAGGVARIHRFRAKGVILHYHNRRRDRAYYVRLDDGQILFLSKWKPISCDLHELNDSPDDRGFPSTEFEIATGPESLLILGIVGTGSYLRPEDEIDWTNRKFAGTDPRHVTISRLESGCFIKSSWEELRKSLREM